MAGLQSQGVDVGVVAYVFIGMFFLVLLVSFGVALSHLEDAGVLSVGVVGLIGCVIAVAVQAAQVRADHEARDVPDPLSAVPQQDGDRFVVRSYSLIGQPDMINKLRVFSPTSVQLSMIERAFVKCGGQLRIGDVDYSSDVMFLVVSKGATSDAFRSDVTSGRVSSIMIAGSIMRVASLTALDFINDTTGVAMEMSVGNDIYLVSARGSAGSVATDKTCTTIESITPWSGLTNLSAVQALTRLTDFDHVGQPVPLLVWGIGGR